MRNVSNTTGSVSYGQTSWETGDSPEAVTGKDDRQELIHQANTVPLTVLFKHYNIRADAIRCIIVCPFKSHKGGRERTGSFKYFSDTNSFYCYGCKIGGEWAHACEFMAHMENISRERAAIKIIKLFGADIDANLDVYEGRNFAERLEIMMDFSSVVREFRLSFSDEKSLQFIEKACRVYDEMNLQHNLDNVALRRCVEELKEEIKNYQPCLML